MHAAPRTPSLGGHSVGRSTLAMPRAARSTSTGSTVLVNLDIYIIRATIGRDISPEDDDLIVLFRRNSKEVTSEPTRWHNDHIAEWNQHIGIQTSLLRSKSTSMQIEDDYLSKDYEVVLVALPSHSAVALFTVDFATIVQTQASNRPKLFRISPAKCRDLAATLEFEVVWEFASPPPPPPPLTPTTSSSLATASSSLSMAGRRTNVSVVSMSSQSSQLPSANADNCSDCRSFRRRLDRKELQITQLENFLKESQKKIDSLVFENEELLVREEAETKNAGQYRALNLRLLQELEMAFQFCVQQMLEAQNNNGGGGGLRYGGGGGGGGGGTGSDPPPPLFMFLPQFEFMERVKKFHAELEAIYGGSASEFHDSAVGPKTPDDAWRSFDFRTEMDTALERNQRLQHQLEFLHRSLAFDGGGSLSGGGGGGRDGPYSYSVPVLTRHETNASSASAFSIGGGGGGGGAEGVVMMSEMPFGSSRVAPVRSVTEQLNALERENFVLKAKLDSALNDLKSLSETATAATASSTGSPSRPSSISASLTPLPVLPDHDDELDQLREDKHRLETQLEKLQRQLDAATNTAKTNALGNSLGPGGSDFLNKIYQDVGKAKVALEEKVKQLSQELSDAQRENERLLLLKQRASSSSSMADEPKIVELTSDDEDGEPPRTEASSSASGEDHSELITQLQRALDEKTRLLEMRTQELEFVEQHLKEKAAQLADYGKQESDKEDALSTANEALAKAQKRVTALEIQIEALQHDVREKPKPKPASSSSSSSSSEEVVELTKQLKLARQEVMQLRYRSNNLESVHEKMEDALKEKKTLQVKLTALEGQLFEQRSRTISDFDKDTAVVDDLHKKLEVKTAQLAAAQRELMTAKDSGELAALERKVARFAAELATLTERNEAQAAKIQALTERVERTERDKRELEGIMEEMVEEMDTLETMAAGRSLRGMQDEEELLEEKPTVLVTSTVVNMYPGSTPAAKEAVRTPPRSPVAARYASALRSKFERRGSAPRPPVPSPSVAEVPTNNVAHLIKNFSSEEAPSPAEEPKVRRGTFGSIKKITKIDFRQRQASDPSTST